MTNVVGTSRRFTLALALIVALALVLRLWAPARLGVDHFDEGVYAFSASEVAAPEQWPGLYPGQEKFSPPVYFALAGWLARLANLEVDLALNVLSALCGAATVALIGFVGRRWFGAGAGLASATLLAFNEYHVVLSRCALTDTMFALAHLGAVYVAIEMLRRERWTWVLATGACVALAWNVKYHGWLALVGAGLAAAPIVLVRMKRREAWAKPIALVALAAIVAAVGYAPWAWFVEQQPGGYADLAAYQRTMLRGGWLENLGRHATQQMFFEGPFTAASLPLAAAACWRFGSRTPSARVEFAFVAAAVVVALIVGGSLDALALLAWIVLWAVLTPFYQPYARLLLPLSIAAMLAAGAALERIAVRFADDAPSERPASAFWTPGFAALAAFALAMFRDDPSDPWRTAQGMRGAASELARSLPERARVFVLGEPGFAWYLTRVGFDAARVVKAPELLAQLEGDGVEAFVVCGVYPSRTGTEQRLVESAGERLELVASAPMEVKDLRVLDDFRAPAAVRFRREGGDDYTVRLYRFRP